MTEADALATDPTATRVEGSLEVRVVPSSPDELALGTGFVRPPIERPDPGD